MLGHVSKLLGSVRNSVRPPRQGVIAGPRGPIPFQRDALGYPRIRARDLLDGTFARGYMHALDRMVQVHLTLVGARGRFMEFLGDQPFARTLDRATRTIGIAHGLQQQVQAMAAPTRALLEAYCDGFNAGVAARVRPPGLAAAGIPTVRLTPAELVLSYRFLAYFGLSSQQHVAEVIVAELLQQGVDAESLELLLGDGVRGLDPEALRGLRLDPLFRVLQPAVPGGSNAFAVSAGRSASGNALLMGEIHLDMARIPPALYAVHIDHEDGTFYQGIGAPGVAWLSVARTDHVAWTFTFGHADNFDVVVERCRDGQYRVNPDNGAARWAPLRRRDERVKVRGRPDEQWTLWDSPYGALVGDPHVPGRYPCVRWSGMDQVWRDFDGGRALHDCTSVEQLLEVQRQIRCFTLCLVAADSAGKVARGWAGQVDQRPDDWAGVVPYPGWKLPMRTPTPRPEEERLLEVAPPGGFVVSANERCEGPDGSCWVSLPEPRYRHDRLWQRVAELQQATVDDLVQISYDTVDLCALRLLQVWAPLLPRHPEVEPLVAWARHGAACDTPERRRRMGLFHALHHEAVRALLEPRLGAPQTRRILDDTSLMLSFQHHLDAVLALQRPHLLEADGLRAVLNAAWPMARARVAEGCWWAPVRARFVNTLTDGAEPAWLGLARGPVELPGSPTAPFQARVVTFDGATMVGGPVNHLVFDMGSRGGWYNLAGGASESPLGPGYGAGIEDSIEGRFLPLGDPGGPAPRLRRSD